MALAAFLGLGILGLAAQQDPTMFPFVIPWDDAVAGTANDVSFLNACPAGKNGRIVAKNGHFVEERTGKRVRFLAVNLTTRAAFPAHEDAERVAAHLAKMGINLVRFHHLQNPWDQEGGMIWKKGRIYLELDPVQLDKLDFLIAALKKHGIYTNLNLQTTRSYVPEMGFPESVLKLTDFAKRVDKFDRRMIELQKQYAHDLLGRTNPYTCNKYADEPALMVVEINNENSLVGSPWGGYGAGLSSLPEPFRGELVSLWNAWLKGKYGSDEFLTKAWNVGTTPRGASLVGPASQWSFESQGGTTARLDQFAPTPDSHASPPASIQIDKVDGTDWHIQAHFVGLTLEDGSDYTVSFEAKADAPRPFGVSASLDQADWHGVGLSGSDNLTTDWKRYSFSFTATGAVPEHNRVALVLGGSAGRVDVRNFRITAGSAPSLNSGESLAKANIDLPERGSRVQRADYIDFLAEKERAYGDEMRAYLRKDLGIKANLVDTQVAWGGSTGLYREVPSDFADNHAYYNHPEFPGVAWDMNNWIVRNTAMTNDMDRGYGELGNLAWTRFAGKPYSISEYNHPAPNDHQVEMMPLFSSFAAVQDWDCLYAFDYGTYGPGQPNDQIQGFFGVGSNPAKKSFFPAAALLFRASEIPAAGEVTTLMLPLRPWKAAPTVTDVWHTTGPLPDLFRTRVEVTPSVYLHAARKSQLQLGDWVQSLRTHRNSNGVVYTGNTPQAQVVVGFFGGQKVSGRYAAFDFPAFGNNFGALTLTSCDGKPLNDSGHVLLTAMGRAENQGMVWNKDRSSVGTNWGHGPVMVEGIPCMVSLRELGVRHVYALDTSGRRSHTLPSTYRDGMLRFTIGPKEKTVWYEIAK